MPPKLNLKRTNVSPEFIDLTAEMYDTWVRVHQTQIQSGMQNARLRHFTQSAARMMPIVRRQSPAARVGLDYEITRFQMLPFTGFTVIVGPHPNDDFNQKIRWLVGRSRHVQATYYNNRKEVAGELGPYDIYLPETMAAHPDLAHIHMIPQRNQKSVDRHFHHYLYNVSEVTRVPLNYPTGNCWGDYTGPIKGLMDEPDFPELFRQLFNHLSTYGDRPPRTRLDFDTETPEHR